MVETIAGHAQELQDMVPVPDDVLIVNSIEQAAQMLGKDPSTIRKQVQAGKRHAEKDDLDRWINIWIYQHEITQEAAEESAGIATETREQQLLTELLASKDRYISFLEERVQFLEQQLSNSHVLLGQAIQVQKALLPPEQPLQDDAQDMTGKADEPAAKSSGFRLWPFGGKRR